MRRSWIEIDNRKISVRRQCWLAGVGRSSIYYAPVSEREENLALMRMIDQQYTQTPFYGVRKMTQWLRALGEQVNHKRVRRLMQVMGLEAVYPKPRLSQPAVGRRIYPYLLRGVAICRANQVWSADITYIRLKHGFVYLVAIIDWYSRYVLSWEVSTTLQVDFCLSALDWALAQGQPEIFNTDQGAQFTSAEFIGRLESRQIRISMDGRGRLDNVFVERLWRSVKYEDVYIKDYHTVDDAVRNLRSYFEFYNTRRMHQSLGYKAPEQLYKGID